MDIFISSLLLFSEQMNFLVHSNYMQRQEDINEKMRIIMIDWLIDVHLKFKLLPETLYVAVGLLDKYLEKQTITRT